MKTKQEVKLLYISPLVLISNAIRYSHATWDKSDTTEFNNCIKCDSKMQILYNNLLNCLQCIECGYTQASSAPIGINDFNLIKRIGFKHKHESVLEHSIITYHLKLSQKALLEATRHRIGVSWTVTSSRYALKKIEINFEPTGDDEMDNKIYEYLKSSIEIELSKGKSLDKISKLLPQSFLYTAQVTFNLRSLLHFLRLRLAKDAHIDIRIIAYLLYKQLPDDYKELLKEDEIIEKHLIRCKDEGFDKLIKSD